MPLTGTLRTWHEDRGFGFIAPTGGGPEVFVHISAFARDGTRPTVGERLSFELGRGKDGKAQALNVVRLALGSERPPPARERALPQARPGSRAGRRVRLVLLLALLVGGLAWAALRFTGWQPPLPALEETPALALSAAPAEAAEAVSPSYRCDGRTHCSQMRSCAEAKWFLQHCPGTQMDGDGDGRPCEQQWCTGLLD